MKKRAVIYFVLVFILASCSKDNRFDCFKSNGAATTETREIGRFDSVEVRDKFDVTLSNGSDYRVVVTAGKHIIKNIKTEIKNGQLLIENRNTCNFVRGYKHKIKIHITTPFVRRVFNNQVGSIVFDDDFKQDTLVIRAENSGDTYVNGNFGVVYSSSHGNGDVYFKGTAKQLLIYTNGTNFTHAEQMTVSDYIYVATYSIGDAYFNLDGLKTFDYHIFDDGSVYYTGTPLTINTSNDNAGKGRLIKQ